MASSDSSQTLDALVEEFVARVRRGEVVSLDAYAERYPDLAHEIRELFPTLLLMEELKPDAPAPSAFGSHFRSAVERQQLGDYRILREVGRGGMGIVYEAYQESLGRHVALKVLPRQLQQDGLLRARFVREARSAARLHHTNIVPVFSIGVDDDVCYYAMQFIHGLGLDEVLAEIRLQRSQSPPDISLDRTDERSDDRYGQTEPLRRERERLADSLSRVLTRGLPEVEVSDATDVANSEPSGESSGPVDGAAPPPVDNVSSGSSSGTRRATLPGEGWSSSTIGRRDTYARSVARIGVQVSEALHYAHEQGVVHRDIKPSNLLLDARGTAWVTDFGLAKIAGTQDITATGDVPGTLRYMPPEVFEGRSSIRSDIYSLGLTLYEMLALRPAFDERDRAKLIHQVTQAAPRRLRAVAPTVPRDLETIVHKAIERDPDQRYRSAAELADDLGRFLRDEPIRARRISRPARAWRWSRRNPLVATMAAVIVVLLLIVTLVSWSTAHALGSKNQVQSGIIERLRQAERHASQQAKAAERALASAKMQKHHAQENVKLARNAVDTYLNQVTESELLHVPGMQPLRRKLLQDAQSFYEQLSRTDPAEDKVALERAVALSRLARIQQELGDLKSSKANLEQAARLLEILHKTRARDLDVTLALADVDARLGREDIAHALLHEVLEDDPTSIEARRLLARLHHAASARYLEERRTVDALYESQRALDLWRALCDEQPEHAGFLGAYSSTLNILGVLLSRDANPGRAKDMYELAVSQIQKAAQLEPQNVNLAEREALYWRNLGILHRELRNNDDALRAFETSIAVQKKLVFQNPALPGPRATLYRDLIALAREQQRMGFEKEALRTMRSAREGVEQLPQESPDELVRLAIVYASLATKEYTPADVVAAPTDVDDQETAANGDRAVAALREAIDKGWADAGTLQIERAFDGLRSRPDFQELAATVLETQTANEIVSGVQARNDHALATQRQSARRLSGEMARGAKPLAESRALLLTRFSIGAILIAQKQFESAHAELRWALDECVRLRQEFPERDEFRDFELMIQSEIGQLYWQQGKLPEAHRAFQAFLAATATSTNRHLAEGESDRLVQAEYAMCRRYFELGLWSQAARYPQRCVDRRRKGLNREVGRFATLLAVLGDQARLAKFCEYTGPLWMKHGAGGLPEFPADAVWVGIHAIRLPEGFDTWLKGLDARRASVPLESYWNQAAGLGKQRLGAFEEAMEALLANGPLPTTLPDRYMALALCQQQRNQTKQARDSLAQGEVGYAQLMLPWYLDERPDQYAMPFERWQIPALIVFRNQAWPLVAGRSPPADPWLPLVESRAWELVGDHEQAARALEIARQAIASDTSDDFQAMVQVDRRLGLARLLPRLLVGDAHWTRSQFSVAHAIWQACDGDAERLATAQRGDREFLMTMSDMERISWSRYAGIGLDDMAREFGRRNVELDRVGTVGLANLPGDGEWSAALLVDKPDDVARQYFRHLLIASPTIPESAWGEPIHLLRGLALLRDRESLARREVERPQAMLDMQRGRPWVDVGAALLNFCNGEYRESERILAPYRGTVELQETYLDAAVAMKLGDPDRALQRFSAAEVEYVQHCRNALASLPVSRSKGFYGMHWWQFYFARTLRNLAHETLYSAAADDPWRHLLRARGWQLLGETSRAADELARAQSLAPDDVTVAEAIRSLADR